MTGRRQSFTDGFLAMVPIVPAVVPFGIICGLTAMATGLSAAQALALSATVFAGASQLATLQLVVEGAVPVIIVLTALVVNLRFAMYSASLAPHLYHLGPGWRWPLAYFLVDQNYAFTIMRYQRAEDGYDPLGHWYFLGGGVALWVTWQAASAVGIFMGGGVPRDWSLDFAIPLLFMALLFQSIRHRPHIVAALTGGTVAALAAPLPYNLGLVLGALTGIAAGVSLELKK